VELSWLGHTLDLKRLNAYDLSQGEFLKYRAVIYFRPVAVRSARRTVESLFEDLRQRAPVPVISRHFSSQADPRAVLPFLIQNLVTASRPGQGMETLAELRARQIGPETVLVFARALVPTSEAPLVREQGYYFVVYAADLRAVIQRIVPVGVRQDTAAPGRWTLPEEVARYGAPEQWPDDTFFAEPVQLQEFLAEQIVRRIRLDVGSRPAMAGLALHGEYADGAFQFHFRLAPSPEPAAPQGFATVIARTAAAVFHSYQFTQFREVAITDADSGGAWTVPAAQVAAFRGRTAALGPAVGP
jgi:hypothetical protein